jgi:hypothetical protein
VNAAEVARRIRQKITFRSNVRTPVEERLNPSAPILVEEVREGTRRGDLHNANVCTDCRAF